MSILREFKQAAGLLLAVLREIFDEAGYERFLASRGVRASSTTYQEFCREHEQGKVRRPRCC